MKTEEELIWERYISPRYLYHASPSVFDESIKLHGIRPNNTERLYDWSSGNYVYLTDDPNLAESFVDPSNIDRDDIDHLFEKGGTLYSINLFKLDKAKLMKDDNWGDDESNSFQYCGVIKPEWIVETKHFDIL